MNSNSVLDIRAGWQRFQEPNVRQHEGLVDPASLGFTRPRPRPVRRRTSTFPLFDFDTLLRHRRQPRRHGDPHHLLVPADLHPHLRQPRDQGRLRLAHVPRVRRKSRAAGGRIPVPRAPTRGSRTTRPDQFGQASPASCSGCRPAGAIERNADASERHDVQRDVRAGRLEADRAA